VAIAAGPGVLRIDAADKTQDALNEIQRDIASLTAEVQALQKAQADQLAKMNSMMQQAAEASTRSSQAMEQSQRSFAEGLTRDLKSAMGDQQSKISGPVADLNNKVNDLSQTMTAVQNQVSDAVQRISRMQSKLDDVYTAVTTAPVTPPTVVVPPNGTAPSAAVNPNAPPNGITAPSLRAAAERDYSAGNSLAMSEFADYVKYFHDDAFAPTAQFRIAELYDNAKQYDDAADAYGAVVTGFPTNEMTAQAAYMKGVELMKGKHNSEARDQFKDVESGYPGTTWAKNARDKLKELAGPASGRGASSSKRGR